VVDSYRGLFEGWEIACAKELIGLFRSRWRSLERENLEDLLQECLLHWHRVRDQFDPGRGASLRTYMAQVVQNRLADIARESEAERRRVNLVASSLEEIDPGGDDDDDGPELLEVLLQHPDAGGGAAAQEPDPDLLIDLARALARLSPVQLALCRLLGVEGLSLREASRRLGVARATLHDELKRIRRVFAEYGLENYFKS